MELGYKKRLPVFTVDCEDWNHALHINSNGHTSLLSLVWLMNKLDQYSVKAVFYVLGKFTDENNNMKEHIAESGHIVKSHGYNHYNWEEADRKPYAFLGFCGGFWMRFLPYWLWKFFVLLQGQMYVHPHDLDEEHPKLRNPIMNYKRHVGLKTARIKLERLLREVKWAEASR